MNFLTELKEGLSISWAAIRANKLRSVLTTLGIIIGIVTVTLMGTAIEGLNSAFVQSISFIGADVLYVQREDWGPHSSDQWHQMQKRPDITAQQVEALARELSTARAIAPVANWMRPIKYKERSSDRVLIFGTTDQYLRTGGMTLAEGRFISEADSDGARPVCVLGSIIATNLFGRESPIGKKVTIGGRPFEVIGVLDKLGGLFGSTFDNQVVIPLVQFYSTFVWARDVDQIQVKVGSLADLDNAREELRSAMRKVRRLAPTDPDDFAINQQDQILSLFHERAGVIAGIGLFITGLSLFVGGIGIMNIMFVSVAERTREIGVRKAIGAKPRTILLQFLIEAATICLIGGLIAIGIAFPMTLVINSFMPAAMSPLVVGIAVLVSFVTGLVSGFMPAWRAARMDPVDALRNE
jgi:putative ABC transport system permease protein